MRRRTFLWVGAGAAASLAAAWHARGARPEDTIEMVIRRRLDYLLLEPQGVRHYARDLAALHVISRGRMELLSALKPIYTRLAVSDGDNVLARKLRHGEDRIVSSYLISSDFFVNGRDETRLVRYLGMLDPSRACGNPFARSPL